MVLLWAVAKAFSIWAYVLRPGEYSDTYYYFLQIEKAKQIGGSLATIFPEYPTPAAWLLMLPSWLGAEGYEGYRAGFLVLVTLFDAAFTALLIARTGPIGVAGWVLLVTLSGRLALLRFDIVPAVLAGAAVLLLLERRFVAAGPVIAAATALKVWPLLLFPLTLARRGRRVAATLATIGTGVLLAALSVWDAGLARLFSPLSYQSLRGLQIEAVVATPAMWRRLTDPSYSVFFSQWNAYEVAGPAVPALLLVVDAALLAGLAVFALVLVRWFAAGCPPWRAAWAALFVIAMMIVTSKAFSPQYMLWLAAPAVVVLGVAWRRPAPDALPETPHPDAPGAPDAPGVSAPAAATASYACVFALMALTVWIYPVTYDDWLFHNARRPVVLVTARNALLVAYTVALAWLALRTPPSRQQAATR